MDKVKMDRRARYTRMVLKQSLLDLMKDRPIGKITVKELCEKADVNRTTFYAHYTDIDELLHQIEDDLLQKVRASLNNGLGMESVSAMMMDILSAIKDNGDLCATLFGEHGDKECLSNILKYAHDQTIGVWRKQGSNASNEDLEKMFVFFSNGAMAIIQEWLLTGMHESPSAIALFIDKMSSLGLSSLES